MTVETNQMRQSHEHFVQKLEASYNDKLILEYDKYLRLEDKMANMRNRYETELEELRELKRTTEESITNDFLSKLHEKEIQIEEVCIN